MLYILWLDLKCQGKASGFSGLPEVFNNKRSEPGRADLDKEQGRKY